jgi:hypothetical protein
MESSSWYLLETMESQLIKWHFLHWISKAKGTGSDSQLACIAY